MLDFENKVSKAVAYIEYGYPLDLAKFQLDHDYSEQEALKEFFICLQCHKELYEIGLTNEQIVELNTLSMGI